MNAISLSNFAVSSGTYGETTTLAQLQTAVKNEFGANYRVAKWSDVVAYHNSGNSAVNFEAEFGQGLSVTYNGSRFYSSIRTYFMSISHRLGQTPHSGYLSHANINNHEFDLGSWSGNRKTLVYTDNPTSPEGSSKYTLESPNNGDLRSGIGVIRGWACDANTVDISINNGEKIQVVYGNSRKDTEGVCGDSNNGFELLVNWALVGAGEHSIQLYLDDVLKSTAVFNVGTLEVIAKHWKRVSFLAKQRKK